MSDGQLTLRPAGASTEVICQALWVHNCLREPRAPGSCALLHPLPSADFSLMPMTLYNLFIQMLIIFSLASESLGDKFRDRERESPCFGPADGPAFFKSIKL